MTRSTVRISAQRDTRAVLQATGGPCSAGGARTGHSDQSHVVAALAVISNDEQRGCDSVLGPWVAPTRTPAFGCFAESSQSNPGYRPRRARWHAPSGAGARRRAGGARRRGARVLSRTAVKGTTLHGLGHSRTCARCAGVPAVAPRQDAQAAPAPGARCPGCQRLTGRLQPNLELCGTVVQCPHRCTYGYTHRYTVHTLHTPYLHPKALRCQPNPVRLRASPPPAGGGAAPRVAVGGGTGRRHGPPHITL